MLELILKCIGILTSINAYILPDKLKRKLDKKFRPYFQSIEAIASEKLSNLDGQFRKDLSQWFIYVVPLFLFVLGSLIFEPHFHHIGPRSKIAILIINLLCITIFSGITMHLFSKNIGLGIKYVVSKYLCRYLGRGPKEITGRIFCIASISMCILSIFAFMK